MNRMNWLAAVWMLCCLAAVKPSRGDEASPAAVVPEARFVLQLAFIDGYGTQAARETTALGITRTGEICVPAGPDGRLVVADRMQPEQLAGLLQEIERIGKLHEIDSQRLGSDVQRACDLAGFSRHIDGSAATVVRCKSTAGQADVCCDGLSVMAARFPDFPELQQLLTVQLRLQNVAAVARAGGEKASHDLATIANRTLSTSHPDVSPLTPRDLSMVRELSSGSRYVQFYRSPSKTADELLVSLFETPGQPPQVNILANPSAATR